MKGPALSENFEKKVWDVIVVGTGMGGAVLGHALAKAGKSVLFCEKGKSYLSSNDSLMGDYAEDFCTKPGSAHLGYREILARAGRWNEEIRDVSACPQRDFVPFIGCGTGGSTALYGMVLERLFQSDFTPRRYYYDADQSTLPEKWPISYDDLVPYYEAAERLFRVRGDGDQLRCNESFDHLLPLPPLSTTSKELFDIFLGKGLHPYRLPVACEFEPGCECCQSYLCNKDCKNDAARICLKPAISDFGAQLLDECEALRLDGTRRKVTAVICYSRGREIALHGKIVVLAAGALASPKILLNSVSPEWPTGFANESGLIGKNLMRHYVDLYAIKLKGMIHRPSNFKELAFNDYYIHDGQKFGTVQSFGAMPPFSVVMKELKQRAGRGLDTVVDVMSTVVTPVAKFLLRRIFSQRVILASIMEDLPYADNRVTLSNKADTLGRRNVILNYRIHEYERARIAAFRKKISARLASHSFMLIKQAENNERMAHACGTCRFGLDPGESVLDANNRAHGVNNLYVVDSSFFPSSGGTNPSLTIAANALRVAAHLVANGTANE